MKHLQGVFPIVATTFSDDGSLDPDSQRRLVNFLLEQGAHGLGLFGLASEGYTLLQEEREQLHRLIVKEVNGRVPVVVSTTHTGTQAAAVLARRAEDIGADALMVLPPFFLKPDTEGIYEFYAVVSDAVNVPVMVQDAPQMTDVPMAAELLARMSNELKNVRYAKVEAPPTALKTSEVIAQAGSALTIFGGLNGQFFLEEIERGARGVMPGSDMIRCFVKMWDLFEAGDKRGAWDLFTRMLPLMRFEMQPGIGVSAMKHNLKSAGVIASSRVRHPTSTLNRQSVTELRWLRERCRCD